MNERSQIITRASSPALDAILGQHHLVLDKGMVRVIDYMGDDRAVVQAARVSYGDGTKKTSDDAGLINRLMRCNHTSPFEMVELKLHIKIPLFVAGQWLRHRTANVNAYSARYSIMRDEFYFPELDRIMKQSQTNKQGSEGELSEVERIDFLERLIATCNTSYTEYTKAIDNGEGVARELARVGLPQNLYTEMYWKIDLHNLLHFLQLRIDRNAQYEIRAYANVIADIVKQWCPVSWDAFEEYRIYSTKLSRKEAELVKFTLGYLAEFSDKGLDNDEWRYCAAKAGVMSKFSKGEWKEFLTKIGK